MTGQTILFMVGALIGVLALFGAAVRLYQLGIWRAPHRPARTLSLLESIALDPRRRIHLVQCGHRQVVVLTGGSQDLVVGWIPDP